MVAAIIAGTRMAGTAPAFIGAVTHFAQALAGADPSAGAGGATGADTAGAAVSWSDRAAGSAGLGQVADVPLSEAVADTACTVVAEPDRGWVGAAAQLCAEAAAVAAVAAADTTTNHEDQRAASRPPSSYDAARVSSRSTALMKLARASCI